MISMLQGYKMYIVAACTIVWAIYGMSQGWIDPVTGQGLILAALGFGAAKSALKKLEPTEPPTQ